MTYLQTTMASAASSDNTARKIPSPRLELNFICDADECTNEGCLSRFEFEDTGIGKDTSMDIVFSPISIKSDFIYAWALEWNTPYKTANFLYFSSPSVTYYLVYDETMTKSDELSQIVYNKMKENVHVESKRIEKADVHNIEYNNEYLVRFVVFEPMDNWDVSQSIKDSRKWDVIFIDGNEETGIISYSKVEQVGPEKRLVPDDDKSYGYVGVPSLLGAVFAEDYDNYKCNMRKALLKLRTVNEIYKIKTDILYGLYESDNKCEFYYANAESHFDGIDLAIADAITGGDFEPDNLLNAMNGITEENLGTYLKSCQKIY